jgi:imidazole glycerol-phosphate synthase subunit HisH
MRKKITIIDYGLGNLASVANALEKLGISYEISGDPDVIKKATALILPGVGAAGQGMKNLKKRKLDKVLIEEIKKGKPFLGICLGMQLLFEKSEEGNVKCLGIFDGIVKKFRKMRKVPQIGWNNIEIKEKNKLFKNVPNKSYVYYVNSFYCSPDDKTVIAGQTNYGETFASIVAKDNVVGMQFHPEKSGTVGFNLLNNFITYYVN